MRELLSSKGGVLGHVLCLRLCCADDARAKIGCTCMGDAWLVRANSRCQERSVLELVYCACDRAEGNSSSLPYT